MFNCCKVFKHNRLIAIVHTELNARSLIAALSGKPYDAWESNGFHIDWAYVENIGF